mmetsp:Transcript_958/g.1557  ORF Transcript_958/g.1557 Transcript_958/m.1557 type:complete len:308 (+) Transcript_958:414-1337(+)
MRSLEVAENEMDEDDESDDDGEEHKGSSFAAEVAKAKIDEDSGGFGRSTFKIEQATTVKSDGKPKKVTVAVISSQPVFLYLAVPALDDAAFIQASTANASPFPLLPSKDVSIFFQNSFIAKTEIDVVIPDENFQLFLGKDPEIQVNYAPVKSLQKSKGLVSKKNLKSHAYQTTVINNKPRTVVCVVTEALPQSREDSIKVLLQDPKPEDLQEVEETDDFKAAASYLEANPSNLFDSAGDGAPDPSADPRVFRVLKNTTTNNLIWILQIPAKRQLVVPFVYTVEWPKNSTQVETTSVFGGNKDSEYDM